MVTATPLLAQEVSQFQISKVFNDNDDRITSIDYDNSGEYLVTSSADHSMRIYSCKDGKLHKYNYSKKYGCNLARFTHNKHHNVIHSSTKEDDTIRYLSFHDNKYIRYFKGHQGKVLNLEMSPLDDTFISSSVDGTVRLWDLKSPKPTGVLNIEHPSARVQMKPIVAYDPSGLVFVVGHNSKFIRLYDARKFESGPFQVTEVKSPNRPVQMSTSSNNNQMMKWHSIKFSNNSKKLVVSTNGNATLLLDGDNGELNYELSGYTNDTNTPLTANFTPDSKFVMCGSGNGMINYWNSENGSLICSLSGHSQPVNVVEFNPKYKMFASADNSLAFWVPPQL